MSWIEPAAYAPTAPFRWRTRGLSHSPEALGRSLWADVTAQWVLVDPAGTQLALAQVYGTDLYNGVSHLCVLPKDERAGTHPLLPELVGLVIDEVFIYLPLRKLLVLTLHSLEELTCSLIGGRGTCEGRLRGYERSRDGWIDLCYYMIDAAVQRPRGHEM